MIFVNHSQVTPTIFPDRTSQVWKLPDILTLPIKVEWHWENEAEVVHICQLLSLLASRQFHASSNTVLSVTDGGDYFNEGLILPRVDLHIPYLPYARQDKDVGNESCFALNTFFNMLELFSVNLDLRISSLDVHSDYIIENSTLVFENLTPKPYIEKVISNIKFMYGSTPLLVYPDKGAYNRYSNMFPNMPSIYFEKQRDQTTGEILSIEKRSGVSTYNVGNINEAFSDVLVIDDICDGGRTFTSLVEHLPNMRRHLYVTHGVFSKGVESLYSSGYESVSVVNDLRQRIFGFLNFRVK